MKAPDLPGIEVTIRRIEKGIRFKDVRVLGDDLGLAPKALSELIGISPATLHRRQKQGKLLPLESDRVVRYEQLVLAAKRVFGSLDKAVNWLRLPQRGLGGAVPLDYAKTEIGAREVEKLLGRIEYGVYP
jgi:putative toxin-antitoxin system antitoxin component (TIGR02293 family)